MNLLCYHFCRLPHMAESGIYFDLYSNLEKRFLTDLGLATCLSHWLGQYSWFLCLIDVPILYSAACFLYNQIRPKQQMIQTNTISLTFYFLCKAYALLLAYFHFDLPFLMFILKSYGISIYIIILYLLEEFSFTLF